ncbi:hypothetical protein SAMN04489727_8696 [Amycolatopsis tolypomycina]|uniref:Uncharacterized protein n=1 Tax=Amycolatopsis tolypomycina TaxID=208445 RepID=A0A1H5CC12_9PSEU|nr:hypothetical protein [Amycolatopsis tolypomycina]SED64028.1 hypothetical protein SAMN04489727_8696 [Amycolatopsis tolypomycina]
MTEVQPFQSFDDRIAGRPAGRVLLEGVPEHLFRPLKKWMAEVLRNRPEELAEAVLLSLGWSHSTQYMVDALHDVPGPRLLSVIDAMLQLSGESDGCIIEAADLDRLDRILRLGRSAYKVADDGAHLTWRVDPTVESAFQSTVAAASKGTAELLGRAWYHAYRPEPDATGAYREAVRAVEEAFVPIVSPKNGRASLGTVVRDLRNQSDKWELVLVDGVDAPASIEPFVGLLDQLWQGQRSRHGGGATSRDQGQAEAEAAVHLAALAVQWLTSGALRRKLERAEHG